MQANATFTVKGWDEKTWDGRLPKEVDGQKMTHAVVGYRYQGDIEGESDIRYLMSVGADGSGEFVALERIEGRFAGRSGSFVLLHTGTFEGNAVHADVRVVPGSGTGELVSLRGEGTVDLPGEMPAYPIVLAYRFED